jgi:hypothetical protein
MAVGGLFNALWHDVRAGRQADRQRRSQASGFGIRFAANWWPFDEVEFASRRPWMQAKGKKAAARTRGHRKRRKEHVTAICKKKLLQERPE